MSSCAQRTVTGKYHQIERDFLIDMIGTYSPGLVVLSIIVAILAAYTALDLVQRIPSLQTALYRYVWLAVGALTMGVGIWSMHFIGMLAFTLPIAVGYDIWVTLASLGIAVVVSSVALHTVTHGTLSAFRLIAGGVLMGVGISAMHYTGMAAMRIDPQMTYDPRIFTASVLIAVSVSMAALWLAFTLRGQDATRPVLRKLGAAILMGLAIAGMHYTGMATARFAAGSISAAAHVVNTWLTISIAGMTFSVLTAALILSVLDARLVSRSSKLADSLNTASDQLKHLATHDAVTDLPNRLLLADRVQHTLYASRRRGKLFAVIYMDLDGFKPVNDSLGRHVGDGLLKAVAERLWDIIRREDTLARAGGDEFVMLMEDIHHPDDAMDMCERVLAAMHEPVRVDDTTLHVTMSIGIAIFPNDGESVEALLQNADAAMCEVKRGGGNGYCYFEHNMNTNALRTLHIQADLRKALDSGELSLHFQPKFNSVRRELIGAEALIRWQHPELGWISPGDFIPIAERSGLILEIGEWVINEACRQLAIWKAGGFEPVKVAVNLSPRQLRQHNLPQRIQEIVTRFDLDPTLLMLEITETAVMEDAEANVEMIHELQDMGFDIAIDDFGTGYSSLSYLQKFRVRQLKVDRLFVDSLDNRGTEGSAIVSAVIALAHSLHMEVVAEGVETDSQLRRLNQLSCDQIQGYLLGRPMPATAFTCLLNERRPDSVNTARRQPDEVTP
jgi:diguanylate cyclase (GGDEF)-like protein